MVALVLGLAVASWYTLYCTDKSHHTTIFSIQKRERKTREKELEQYVKLANLKLYGRLLSDVMLAEKLR